MADYDIGQAFKEIEEELIASMIRNLERHKAWEEDEGFQWDQWQVLQLQSLERYRRLNRKKFKGQFEKISRAVDDAIRAAREDGRSTAEAEILQKIKDGFADYHKASSSMSRDFFRLNERKLNALISATQKDFTKAEHAILRMANDQYRKVIYSAQVYANSGAGTYEKAIDMATKDFLQAGLNCVEYKNGARHTLHDYADMAIRTATTRAYLAGEGEMRNEWGIHTVIVNKRTAACSKCMPFAGKIMIDDVYANGSRKDGPYTLVSQAIEEGFLHPRCKDTYSTYFPGLDDDKAGEPSKADKKKAAEKEEAEAKQNHAELQAEKYERMAENSLDPDNQKKYEARAEEWKTEVKKVDELTARRKERLAARRKAEQKPAIEFDDRVSEQQKELLQSLAEEYKTRLERVTVGAEKSAGDVDVSGARMRLSDKHDYTAIHEFAHTLAYTDADKFGLTHDQEFWKEIRKIRREYMKDVEGDSLRWISTYEHSSRSLDEFMAEAFTHAKMREMGLPIPDKYGSDFKYSQKVLDTVNKYFGRGTVNSIAKSSGSDIIKTGARIINPLSPEGEAFAKMYYPEIRKMTGDIKRISQNTGLDLENVQAVKNYLFMDKSYYDPDIKDFRRFDPDCAIAQSWQRLMIGKDIKPHDKTLLNHEIYEMEIKKNNPEIKHEVAHEIAAKKYNYGKEADEYYGNLEKHSKK